MTQALRRLEALHFDFGAGRGAQKLLLLRELERGRLGSPQGITRLHEVLCFMRAYPDDHAVLAQVVVMLNNFSKRADLQRHVAALDDSGIAGTQIRYRFYWPTARRLAARWPQQLCIDWDAHDEPDRIAAALPMLSTPIEAAWLRGRTPSAQVAITRMNAGKVGEGTFLVRRIEAMPGDDFTREAFADSLDTPMLIKPEVDTPSRTLSWHSRSPITFVSGPLRRIRPDLRAELERPPRAVRAASPIEGERLIELAMTALVTRSRDLDGIAYGNARDVWMIDDAHGLQWAFIGLVPERRQLLRASHGFLTLKNGVPIGYGQMDTLFGCADVSFNSFDTFRGAETAWVFARLLAATKALLGARSFTLDGYQLGHHNEEAIASGAWWFYQKLGFFPLKPATRKLATAELTRMKANPAHLTSKATLRKLSADTMVFETDGARAANWPRLADLGALAADLLAGMTGGDREATLRECSRATLRRLGLKSLAEITTKGPDAQRAWDHWAPLVCLLSLSRWNRQDRHALAEIILAKGAASEREFLTRFDDHEKLALALRALTRA
jgi:hypothetical protein